jgi:replication-associated recombination protein RarA
MLEGSQTYQYGYILSDLLLNKASISTPVYLMIEKLGIEDTQSALAQLVVTMCLSKKSTRSYRGLNNALAALKEPWDG